MEDVNEKEKFWKVEPSPIWTDWRALSLFIPSVASALGLCTFAVFAFSFTALPSLNQRTLDKMVVAGGLFLAFGGEIGTLFTSIEIFRKRARGETTWMDWAGLTISFLATVPEFLLAQAVLTTATSGWMGFFRTDGVLWLVLAAAADSYVNFMEAGFYLASYDKRMESWLRAKERWLKGEYFATRASVSEPGANGDNAQANSQPLPERIRAKPSELPLLTCSICGATSDRNGKPFRSRAALSGHMGAHKRTKERT